MKRDAWKTRGLALLGQYKYVILVVAVGAALLLLPPLWEREEGGEARERAAEQPDSGAELEARLSRVLSKIDGAGEVEVVLTLKSGPQQVLAQDVDTTLDDRGTQSALTSVVISRGGGEEEAVVIQQLSPQYQGALVVCSGGDDPQVRLRIVEAVAALTGLGADQISVCKGK